MADPFPTSLPDAPRAGGETPDLMALHRIAGTLAFFASVIRSGESFTSDCERAHENARTALAELRVSLLERQRDGERLDWLEKCARDALNLAEGEYDDCRVIEAQHHNDVPEGEVCFTAIGAQMRPDSRNGSYYTGEGMTIREAVDAVMSRVSAPSAERA